MKRAQCTAATIALSRFLLIVACSQLAPGVSAQSTSAIDRLKAEVANAELVNGPDSPVLAAALMRLGSIYYAQARYREAEPLYERSLGILEKSLGPEHLDVATSLGNLANLYQVQGRYGDAEPLYERSLAIREKSLGPEHPSVAIWLNNQAELYRAQGRHSDAEPRYRRSLAIREKSLGPEHSDVAQSLNNLAELHRAQGRYGDAEPLFKRSLAIYEKSLGLEHPSVAALLQNLAALYQAQGRYGDAEPLYGRSLVIYEKSLGFEHRSIATSLSSLAVLYLAQGRYGDAEPLLKRSLAIREKSLGPEHPDVAHSLNNLAGVFVERGRYSDAEPLYKRSLAIREKSLGPEHPDVAISLRNLGYLYDVQGRGSDAEPLYRRSLAIRERSLGFEHPSVATSLNSLATLYQAQRRYGDAESLLKRSLAIREKSLGPEHPNVAHSLHNLAGLYLDQRRYSDAEPLYRRSLAIHEKSLGVEHPNVAIVLNSLGSLYRVQGRSNDAEPLYERSLAIREKSLGPEHPDVAQSLTNLALLYRPQRRYGDAEPLLKRSLAILEKSLGPEHPGVAQSLNNLAGLYEDQRRYLDALPLARRASSVYRQRILAATDDNSPREATANRVGFFRHLTLLLANAVNAAQEQVIEESFGITQLAQATSTGAAVAKMAARFARGDDALAVLVKRKQDLTQRLRKGEDDLVKAAGEPPDKRNRPAEQRLRDDLAGLGHDLAAVDAQMQARFPQYQLLTRPEPLEVRAVQALLRTGEALIAYSIAPNGGWSWVIRPGHAAFLPLRVNEKELAQTISKIRAQMEPDNRGRLALQVDVQELHELYQKVFAPATAHLADAKHVMLVPAGPLQSLPFGMLVASPPKNIRSPADYREVDWLAKHYALSVLPSVSSIRALREFAKAEVGREPFAGFGDPQLSDSPARDRDRNASPSVAAIFRNLNVEGAPSRQLDIADVRAIKRAPSLPETADELRAMAKTLKAGDKSFWLRDKATESTVKRLDLSKYRVIAFATHGVMAGELSGIAEPGLILTPPSEGTTEDDGYLSAGEIAQLRLNADWVLLSACNTAAADGAPGAEGLSGLAKAFFYAGSRSLLVSHWRVASEATVLLTTAMLREYEANPSQGKSEAHRKAVLELMNTANHPEYAHPFFWAPFVVVGEGGK